jgi:Ca2+-binding RTX toxin-like protein
MIFNYEEAKAKFSSLTNLADLIDLVRNTAATVEGAPENATSLLYGGEVFGEESFAASKALVESTAGESGASRLVRVDQSSVGKLLFLQSFQDKVKALVEIDLKATVAGFEELAQAEKDSLITKTFQEVFFGKDSNGNRLPVNPNNPSMWDIASGNWVDQAKGNFRLVIGHVSELSITMQTELSRLMVKVGNPTVDGIELDHLKTLGVEGGKNSILAEAIKQTHLTLTDLSPESLSKFKAITPERVGTLLADESRFRALATVFDYLPDNLKERVAIGQKTMVAGAEALANSGIAKGVNKLGIAGAILGLLFTASASAAEYNKGNTEEAANIAKKFAAGFVGGIVGGIAGEVIAGIVVGIAATAGAIASAPVVAAVLFTGMLVGGFMGTEAATELYELMGDRDNNGKRDIVDKLSNLFFGANSTITTPLPADLNGEKFTVDASLTRDEMVTNAKRADNAGMAWRYALRELNSFVITDVSYAAHNTDGSLDLYDKDTNPGGLTNEYLVDRAAMLAWKLQFEKFGARDDNDPIIRGGRGAKPYTETWDSNTVQGNWDFIALDTKLPGGAPLKLAIDGQGISQYDHQIIFGSKEADTIDGSGDTDRLYGMAGSDTLNGKGGADYLEGGGGNDTLKGGDGQDTLIGGTGEDTLDGGGGADQLQGGAGSDTYILRANDSGIDTIVDTDGQGLIKVTAADGNIFALGAGTLKKLANSNNTWQSEDKLFTYTTHVEADGSTTLSISGAGVSAVVKNFTSGNLGINLPGSVASQSNPATGQQILGDLAPLDTNPTLEGVQTQNDALGNVMVNPDQPEPDRADTLYDSVNDDEIIAGGGADHVIGTRGGTNWIKAGSGRDTVQGGAGSDLIELGTERDYGVGGGGADRLYADVRHTVDEVLAQTVAAADEQADIMDGGNGDDSVMGDAGNDALFGGEGKDLLVGGAGDDYMFGDRETTAVSSEWDIHQELAYPNEEVSPAALVVMGVDSQLASQEGVDLMLGGAGNDFMLGNGGDDYLDGGTGNDHMFGGAGADSLQGGEGHDLMYGDGHTNDATRWEYAAASAHGNDLLDGGAGNDDLWGGGKDDVLYGGAGDDSLRGDAFESELASEFHGDDYLDGGDGNDLLRGDGKNDTLYGGAGDDILDGDMFAGSLAGEFHGDDYLNGGDGDDSLVGNGKDDTLYGGAGNDELWGDSPSNTLTGQYHGNDYLDGGDGTDTLVGGGGADTLEGGSGDDLLEGDSNVDLMGAQYHGDDYLDGGEGNDVLMGEGGADTLIGGAGNDDIYGDLGILISDAHYLAGQYHGKDYIDAGDGDDYAEGNGGDDTLYGGAGADVLWGDAAITKLAGEFHGDDLIDGGAGNDQIAGGGGADTLYGGAGDDLIFGDKSGDTAEDDPEDLATQYHGKDTIDGGTGNDKLWGDGGDDFLLGGDGNDTLYGGTGNDRLEGGAGDDILMGGDGDDILVDTEGNNTFDAGSGNDAIAVGDMDNTLQGGEGDDTVTAGHGHNVINGGAGNDHLGAGNGNNTLNGDEGNDTLTAGDGNNILSGGDGNDSVTAGNGDNTLNGDEGNDTITAGSGNNILSGGNGNDTVTSGSGNDTLNGDDGNDVLSAGDGNNTLLGGNGNDSLTSGSGVDSLDGGDGNDTLHAGSGNDVLNGGNGDDMVYGEGGDDVLHAGYGKDTLAGGDGLDTYVLGYSADRNTVVDDSAEGSVIKLGSAGMKFEDLAAARRGNDLVVEVRGTSASMRIKDYYASTQTSWVFEDAEGNTTTGEVLVAASQPDWAMLQADLLKDFQSTAFGSISKGYSDGGYTQRLDGSWYRADSYGADISKTYVKRTEFFRDISYVTSSHVSAGEWTGDTPSQSATDTTAAITFQTNVLASGTETIQSYNYAFSFENAWSSVHWTKNSSNHFESEWQPEYGIDPSTGGISLNGYTRVDIDTDYYSGTANQLSFQDPGAAALAGNLPASIAVDFWHRQDSYNLGPSLLADGDQTVWADGYSAVIGGVGNNVIYGAGFAYGGTGNAQLIGGGTLMAGTGDQLLQYGETMVVGDGHDTVVGYSGSRVLVNPDNLGIDLIGQDFDWESDKDYRGQSYEIRSIYRAMGYEDWTHNYQYGGKFRLDFGEDFEGYFDSIEDARATFVPSDAWPTFDIAMAYAFTTWRYVEPLTALYKTPYTSVEDPASELVASSYYAAHAVTSTMLTANDFVALQPLLDAELLPASVISFGPGLSLADLTLSWGEAVAPLDGVTHVTLDILWGTDQGIRIMMPRSGDALNSVPQQFEFSDGTVSSLLDLIALAPPAPDFDTGYSRIFAGMGAQTADAADVAGIRAVVASAGDLKVESDGVDLVISIIGSSDSLRIAGWYADAYAMPQAILFTSDGSRISPAEMTGRGLFKDGSAGDLDLYGVPGFATTFIAGPNTRMTGNSGMDVYVYNAGSGEVHISDPGGGAVRFGGGVSATATLGLALGSLLIKLGNQGDMIYLENFDPSDAENFESVLDFEFANGSTLSLQDLLDQGFDLSGTSDADTITGTSVTDRILAGAGDDVLQGGRGDDTLGGGAGSDVYLFSRGDGLDTINEDDATAGNVDTIRFDDSVSVADVRVSREGLNLYLSMDGSTDRIEISNWFSEGADTVEQVEFADGTVWGKAELEARLPTLITGTEEDEQLDGSDAFEILDGQGGNDLLSGGAGNDVYLFKRGDGQDLIDDYDETLGNIDAVRFDSGISAADVRVTRDSYGHLFLNIDGTQDRIQLNSWFQGEAYQVERVLFADGTVWSQEDLIGMAVFGPSEGSDYLDGTEDGDYLLGMGGGDLLYGEAGNDILDGGSGDDYLKGGAGDDLMAGGTGEDILDGGVGNDVYLYSRGDGTDYIADYDETVGNVDTLRFYDGTIAAGDIKVTRGNLDLYLHIDGTSDLIALTDWFGTEESQLERVEFADGTVWDGAMLESLITLAPGTEDNDVLYGAEASEVLNALGGDDELYGNGGDDTLDGGTGNDYLEGGTGNDVYLFGRGSGNDEISDYDETVGNIDTVRFDGTVAVSDIRITRDSSSLFLTIDGTSDRVTLGGWFEGEAHQVETIEFADGTVWNKADLEAFPIVFTGTEGNDMLLGTDGADVIDGGAGDDTLNGGAGNDVYLYKRGDGSDTIRDNDALAGNVDTLRFDGTVSTADVQVTRDSGNLYLGINGTDTITLADWFSSNDRRIEQVEFADGTIWSTSALESMAGMAVYEGTEGDDVLMGSMFGDMIDGGTGNDLLNGNAGNDVYLFKRGDGSDTINEYDAAVGNIDTIRFDSSVAAGDIRFNRSASHLYLSTDGTADVIMLKNWFINDGFKIEQVEFADGTLWNKTDFAAMASAAVFGGTDGNDYMVGATSNDILKGLGGNDMLDGTSGFDVLEGGAGDDHLVDGNGRNYLNGGAGADTFSGNAAAADLFMGGTGNDVVNLGNGQDIIAFNVGDGQDTMYASGASVSQDDTISLGGAGLDYANLSLQKSGNDLVLNVSATDQLTFYNWYGSSSFRTVLNLQLVAEAMAAFDANSSDPLLNKKVQAFDFQGLVGAFDAARTATPGLSSWALSNGLTQFHLAGSDSEALGGDLAYHYGADGTLAGMGLGKAQDVLTNAQFGAQAQGIHSTASLQEGLIRLG